MAEVVALMAERREEIRAVHRLWRELSTSLGVALAEHVISEAILAEAEASGRRSAPEDPARAGLAHFAAILASRDDDGGVETRSVDIDDADMVVERARCDYPSLYREAGLGDRLAVSLSCGREAAFAKGYDSRLRLDAFYPPNGVTCRGCRLVFHWDADTPRETPPPRSRLRVRDL